MDAARDREASPFGSVLSLPEFALGDAAGLTPIAAVMGCDVRWLSQFLPTPGNPGANATLPDMQIVAVDELDAVVAESRRAAFDHLRAEATAAAADVVVGIRQVQTDFTPDRIRAEIGTLSGRGIRRDVPLLSAPLEWQLVGTAMRDPSGPAGELRVCTLPAQDVFTLRRGGWEVAGVVGGVSHWLRGLPIMPTYAWGAHEFEPAGELWAVARRRALEQMTAELRTLGADGAIGVEVAVGRHEVEWQEPMSYRSGNIDLAGVVASVALLGTAIRRADPAARMPSPMRILTLR